MLSGLFSSPVRRMVVEALDQAGAHGAIVADSSGGVVGIVGRADVGRAVREHFPRLSVEVKKKARSGAPLDPFPARSLVALVAPEPDAPEQLGALLDALADGGVAVLVGHGDRRRSAGRALSAGLSLIEQRRAGRTHVTSGICIRL